MANAEKENELFENLKQGVIDYDENVVRETAQAVIEEGIDAYTAVFEGLVKGMNEAGRLYEEQWPEILMCARALYAGLRILKPHIEQHGMGIKGTVVMGVVQGDVHDIGKNIIKIMFEAAGFDVHDLGRDVPTDQFVKEQLSTDSDLVLLSATMITTATMAAMKDIIAKIKETSPNCRIMIGGAPELEELSDKWGVDGFARDANNALKDALDMVKASKGI